MSPKFVKVIKILSHEQMSKYGIVHHSYIFVNVTTHRLTVMEALNEQKQLIRQLISKQDNQTESQL